MKKTYLLLCIFIGSVQYCEAKTSLPVPRFVSSRPSEMNIRVGPGPNYPVAWKLVKANIPLEITAEFDTWRRVRDWDGMTGWVHQSMLSGQRYAVVTNKEGVVLRSSPGDSFYPVAKVEYNARALVKKCRDEWCLLRSGGYEGWSKRQDLWGAYPKEKIG